MEEKKDKKILFIERNPEYLNRLANILKQKAGIENFQEFKKTSKFLFDYQSAKSELSKPENNYQIIIMASNFPIVNHQEISEILEKNIKTFYEGNVYSLSEETYTLLGGSYTPFNFKKLISEPEIQNGLDKIRNNNSLILFTKHPEAALEGIRMGIDTYLDHHTFDHPKYYDLMQAYKTINPEQPVPTLADMVYKICELMKWENK